jgi:ADP-ribose pyrophosphatase YjhB (NUDIX family)
MNSRLYPDRPFLAASVAVFREGYVLLASRTKPPADLLYSLPGGLVEPGERLEEAALRELAEEVGVQASIVGFNDHVEIIERDDADKVRHHFVVASFVARWVAGEPTTGPEAGHVIWVLPGAVGEIATTPGLPRIIANAKRLWEAAG